MKRRTLLAGLLGAAAASQFPSAIAQEALQEEFVLELDEYQTLIINPSHAAARSFFPALAEQEPLPGRSGLFKGNGDASSQTRRDPYVTFKCTQFSFDADIPRDKTLISFSALDDKLIIERPKTLQIVDMAGLKPDSSFDEGASKNWPTAPMNPYAVVFNLQAHQFRAWGCGARFLSIDPKNGRIDVSLEDDDGVLQLHSMKIATTDEIADTLRKNPRKPVPRDYRKLSHQ